MKPFEDRHSRLDQSLVILGKVPDRGLVSPNDLSGAQEWSIVTARLA